MRVKLFTKTKLLFCNISFYPIMWEIVSLMPGQGPPWLFFKKLGLLTSLSLCNLQLTNKNCETLLCVRVHNFKLSCGLK